MRVQTCGMFHGVIYVLIWFW